MPINFIIMDTKFIINKKIGSHFCSDMQMSKIPDHHSKVIMSCNNGYGQIPTHTCLQSILPNLVTYNG